MATPHSSDNRISFRVLTGPQRTGTTATAN